MLGDLVTELGCGLASSEENSGEEPGVEELELEREEGMKTVGRGNAA